MGVGEIVGGALGIGGSLLQSSGSSKAANAASASANAATQAQLQMYQQTREDLAPWRSAGTNALNTYQNMLAQGPGQFNPQTEPGYQFGYQQFVENPTLRTAAATGLSQSGRTLKSLSRYASDYASTKYDDFLNRWYQKLQPYQNLSLQGQNAASQTAQASLGTGQAIANNTLAAGQAQASNYLNQGNIFGSALSQTGQNVLNSSYLNTITKPQTYDTMPWWVQQENQW